MTNPAFAVESSCTLLDLLSDEFSEPRLAKVLGSEHRVPEHLWDAALVGPLSDFLGRPGKEFRARLVRLARGSCIPRTRSRAC